MTVFIMTRYELTGEWAMLSLTTNTYYLFRGFRSVYLQKKAIQEKCDELNEFIMQPVASVS